MKSETIDLLKQILAGIFMVVLIMFWVIQVKEDPMLKGINISPDWVIPYTYNRWIDVPLFVILYALMQKSFLDIREYFTPILFGMTFGAFSVRTEYWIFIVPMALCGLTIFFYATYAQWGDEVEETKKSINRAIVIMWMKTGGTLLIIHGGPGAMIFMGIMTLMVPVILILANRKLWKEEKSLRSLIAVKT